VRCRYLAPNSAWLGKSALEDRAVVEGELAARLQATGRAAGIQARLDELEAAVAFPGVPAGMRLTTELGISQERALVRFWSRLASS
jgi:hypothetical protein